MGSPIIIGISGGCSTYMKCKQLLALTFNIVRTSLPTCHAWQPLMLQLPCLMQTGHILCTYHCQSLLVMYGQDRGLGGDFENLESATTNKVSYEYHRKHFMNTSGVSREVFGVLQHSPELQLNNKLQLTTLRSCT